MWNCRTGRALHFEWDEEKAEANYAKHGVSFEDAVEVFLDPYRLEAIDERFNYGEERLTVLGMVQLDVLFVVATERAGDALRVISARRATRQEQRAYFLHRADI